MVLAVKVQQEPMKCRNQANGAAKPERLESFRAEIGQMRR